MMITDFQSFGPAHLFALFSAAAVGVVFILLGVYAKSERQRRILGILFAVVIIVCRGSRYVMDAFYGVFEWYDLFSLHICHIDLIYYPSA